MDQRRQPPPQQQGQQRRRPVNVAEIMAQIRRRIEQKKKDLNIGTELEDLQAMKLNPLPDPHQVRPMRAKGLYAEEGERVSELLRPKHQEPHPPLIDPFTRPQLVFERPNVSAETLFYSSRGASGRFLMLIRKFTRPLLKLFVNVDAYVYEQSQVNQALREMTVALSDRLQLQIVALRDRDDQILHRIDSLSERAEATRTAVETAIATLVETKIDRTVHYVRLLHEIQTNLVAELTKLAIENQNLKSRLSEINDRLEVQGKREAILEEQVQRVEDAVTPVEPVAGTGKPDDGA